MAVIRIMPATMLTALLLIGVKVIDISRNERFLSLEAMAEASEKSPTDTSPKKPEKLDDKKSEKSEKSEKSDKDDKKSDKDKKEGKSDKEGGEAKGEKSENGEKADKEKKEGEGDCGEEGKDKKKDKQNFTFDPGDIVDHRFTPIELDMLQNLVSRRKELDTWEKNIAIKEAALDATEKRVDQKINQIQAMKKEVSTLLAQYNEKEDAKIRSLVKIYQGMKPKDAARIFDELDTPIVLLVIDKMPEKTASNIIALMDPKKAKTVTVQLAERRRLGAVKTAEAPLPEDTTAPSTENPASGNPPAGKNPPPGNPPPGK